MSKRNKCQHNNNAIKVQGCAECCVAALQEMRLLGILGLTAMEAFDLVRLAYPTQEEFDAAVAKVRANTPATPPAPD